MSDIPEENNAALQKRRAIQSVMRDTSLSAVERNKRMQDIMRGNFMPKEVPPTPATTAVLTKMEDAPDQGLQRRGSSAKDLIKQFEEAEKHSGDRKVFEHEVSFMSVHSAEGRGHGFEEVRKQQKRGSDIDEADLLATLNEGGDDDIRRTISTESNSKLTEEEKKKHAFVTSKLVATKRSVLNERIRASSHDEGEGPKIPSPENSQQGAFNYAPKRSSSGTTLDQYEQRIMQKTAGGAAAAGAPKRSSSGTTLDEYEKRIMQKTSAARGAGSAGTGAGPNTAPPKRTSSGTTLDEYEKRILQKTSAARGAGSAGTGAGANAAPPKRTSSGTTLDEYEKRILQKTAAASGSGAGASNRGSASSTKMNDYEARILKKTMSSDSQDSSRNGSSALGSSSHHSTFEQKILEKTARSHSNSSGDVTPVRSGSVLSKEVVDPTISLLEQRILEKTGKSNQQQASAAANASRAAQTTAPAAASSSMTTNRLENRIRDKLHRASKDGAGGAAAARSSVGNESMMSAKSHDVVKGHHGSASSAVSALTASTGLHDSAHAMPPLSPVVVTAAAVTKKDFSSEEEVDPNVKKRKAIQQIMKDHTLTPQERNRRLQAVMSGKWEMESSMDESGRDMSESDRDDPITLALEAKIVSKLKKKADHKEDQDDREEKQPEGGEEIHNESHHDDESQDDEDGPGVGYGSLPRPEEHFPQDSINNSEHTDPFHEHEPLNPNQRDTILSRATTAEQAPPRSIDEWAETVERDALPIDEWAEALEADTQRGAEDPTAGLAVASAVAPDDEPDYVYNAIEYDPEAKPPLHRNRRFRIYTYFALIMIAIVVIWVVVYITSASKQDEIIDINIQFQKSPTISPTFSPITDREASGIIEQLEGGVLRRDESFSEMARSDSRLMALDWILHKDMMQLVSDDVNLYQRYALAVLAYAMDSRAWYICGDPGEDYRTDECTITYWDNSTTTHGVWLSSTSECGWLGVTCSSDGVVRAVDLPTMDLIGTLPIELSALRFLQLLALPNNCIYGTIPPEIGELNNLLSLELHGNGLSGEMPKEMYDLKNLQLLNLADQWGGQRECTMSNNRTVVDIKFRNGGLADEERGLLKLELNSGLSGTLNDDVGVWRSLKGLYLNKNSFIGTISEEFGKMRYLRFLWLHDNFIEGSLPETMTKLKNLRYLKLEENFIVSSFPSEMGRLNDLEILTVNGNSMYGEIPNGLYKMKKMEILRLDNTMTQEPPWMVVSDEGFTGSINPLIGDMQDLRWLFLSDNPMNGTIPSELGLCEKLEIVRVHRSNIGGTMPREVCQLRDKSLNSDTNTGVLYSDCSLNNSTSAPFMRCDCCSDCCDHTTGVCVADD